MIHSLIHGPWPYLVAASALGAASSLVGGWVARRRTWPPARRRVAWALLLVEAWTLFWGWSLVATTLWRPDAWPYLELAAVLGAVCSLVGGIVERVPDLARRRLGYGALLAAALAVFTVESLVSR